MQESSPVLYYGSDAPAVEQRWRLSDRPFELVGRTSGDEAVDALVDGDADCLICAGDGDVLAVVDRVRESLPHVPVVALGAGDLDAATALDHGVTHFADVDGDGRIGTIEALESVVDRYRCERRERTMLDSLLENIPLSVYFKDTRSRHVAVSDEMLSMIGNSYIESPDGVRYHTPEDVVGVTDFDLYQADLAESATADDRRVVETEEPIENRIEHAYGSVIDGTYVATSKAPWHDERGNVVGTVGVTRDISERKRHEHRLERQNERLERFGTVLSHDLRNPLEVARGRLDFAREDGDDEHFDAIERSLERMDELIDDVLELARRGQTVTDPEPVELAAAARQAWNGVESGDATLAVDTDLVVTADPGRLSQLFENLFRNAVEHGSTGPRSQTPEDADEHGARRASGRDAPGDAVEHGSTSPASNTQQDAGGTSSAEPSVADAPEDADEQRSSSPRSSSTHEDAVEHGSTGPDSQARQDADEHAATDPAGLTVTVAHLPDRRGFFVADDGVGIPEADRDSVFDSGFSTADDGTGLGLDIVRTIADAHGWRATVTESDDGGARFQFESADPSEP